MGGWARKVDAFLAALASRQHGVVTRRQLLDAGFTGRVIDRRIASGNLIPIHRGVYLVGHRAISAHAYEAAAILACGPHAVLSHRTAARVWGLPVSSGGPIHLTVMGRHRRSLADVEVHSVKELAGTEHRRRHGLPITSPALTVLDLAGTLKCGGLTKALNEARVLRLVSQFELEGVLIRHPNRSGARALRRLLAAEAGPSVTRSEAERRALAVMRARGIHPDASDFAIGPYRLDFWFERERVAVEIDGYRYHGTPMRFAGDRHRTAYLASLNIQVFPLVWADVTNPERPMARLRETLAARRRLLGTTV